MQLHLETLPLQLGTFLAIFQNFPKKDPSKFKKDPLEIKKTGVDFEKKTLGERVKRGTDGLLAMREVVIFVS